MINNEKNKYIVPYRYLPFDIGCDIDINLRDNIKRYLKEKKYIIIDNLGLIKTLSNNVLFGYKISDEIFLYIYKFGIGVFSFKGNTHECVDDNFAISYCKERKDAYSSILTKNPTHKFYNIFETIAFDIREIANSYCESKYKKSLRVTASKSFECLGFSYIMSVSYIVDNSNKIFEFSKSNEILKKNLLVLLEPGLANLEESKDLKVSKNSNSTNIDVNEYNPKNWLKKSGRAVYISWSAVVVIMDSFDEGIVDLLNAMEVDLQAMWMYTYCLYNNIVSNIDKEKKVSQMKNKLFEYKRIYSGFKSNGDSNLPEYIFNMRDELIKTSLIQGQYDRYTEYLDYRIEETESKNIEEQQKYNVISEILLFIIAYIQIVPSIHSVLTGEIGTFITIPNFVIFLLAIIGIVLIIVKDK